MTTLHCPKCNTEVAPDAQQCTNCGQRLNNLQKMPTLILSQQGGTANATASEPLVSQSTEPAHSPVVATKTPASNGGFAAVAPPATAPTLPVEPTEAALITEPETAEDEKTEPALPSFWKCNQCISLNPANVDYCENCGALKLSAEPMKLTASASVPENRKLEPLLVTANASARTIKAATTVPSQEDNSTAKLPTEVIAALWANEQASHMRLVSASGTDEGLARKGGTNEDSYFTLELRRCFENKPESFGLYIVADGMGGQAAGEIASRMAIESVAPVALTELASIWMAGGRLERAYVEEVLRDAVSAAHTRLIDYNQREERDAGTTITICCIVQNWAVFANVGDSRTYLFRRPAPPSAVEDAPTDPVFQVLTPAEIQAASAIPTEPTLSLNDRETKKVSSSSTPLIAPGLTTDRVTRDQSLVQHLMEQGEITLDEVYSDPRRNVILHALGAPDPQVPVDVTYRDLELGDVILLSSDGLWEMVRDNQMVELILAQPDLHTCVQSLIALANYNGGADNITVVMVRTEK